MADKTLLDIARELNLPESTLRAWRDAYEEYIPVTGEGRRRRYPEDAALVFLRIQELSNQGHDREAIRQRLQEEGFPRYFATSLAPQRNAVASSQPVVEALATALEQIAASNRDVASAIAQTGELAAKVERLEAERGMLAEEVGKLRDELARLTRYRRRLPWWRRILEG